MVVMPPLRPESMKSIARWRGVKSPKTGWQCESMRPGITVLPLASMTVSASPSSPFPTATILPLSATIESPSSSGLVMSPETIWPMFLISVFNGSSWAPLPLSPQGRGQGEEWPSHRQVFAAEGLVAHQHRHGPVETDLALLDDVGTVGQPRQI